MGDQIRPQTMKVLLFLAGLLLCLHISEGFTYRGNLMRNRNRGGGRSYLRNLGGGRQRMGGMGFGKTAYDYDYGNEDYSDYGIIQKKNVEYGDEAELESLEDQVPAEPFQELLSHNDGAEKRASTGEAPEQDPKEKRGISSLKGKRGISSLKGKRAFGMALSALRSRGRGKRGALSSLRNQGFVKYNI